MVALTVRTDQLRRDGNAFGIGLYDLVEFYEEFHQVHYSGLGLVSARSGKVLPFFIAKQFHRRGLRVWMLVPTKMALEECACIAPWRIFVSGNPRPWSPLEADLICRGVPGKERVAILKAAAAAERLAKEVV